MSHPTPYTIVNNEARERKRVRVSVDDHPEGRLESTPSEMYWFEDGNIILHVDNKLFKVHRGILSRHSAVFSDMFALPQPETQDEENVIEGCSVVNLPGDRAKDWERLLAVLYDFDTLVLERFSHVVQLI